MAEYSTLKLSAAFIALLTMQGSSFAQDTTQHQSGQNPAAMDHSKMKMDHSSMTSNNNSSLPVATEGGQGGFTAIAEIVALLQADPNTDWSKVNIDALREHLVDMNELAMHSNATATSTEKSVTFTITGSDRALTAVHNMVPAHAGVLTSVTNWVVDAKVTSTGAVMTLNSDNPAEIQKIKALGFFGVMATGAHHQAHHVLMATGAGMVRSN